MQVYSRATKAVPPEEKLSIYNIYLQHAQQIYGVTKTREIYQVCWFMIFCSVIGNIFN